MVHGEDDFFIGAVEDFQDVGFGMVVPVGKGREADPTVVPAFGETEDGPVMVAVFGLAEAASAEFSHFGGIGLVEGGMAQQDGDIPLLHAGGAREIAGADEYPLVAVAVVEQGDLMVHERLAGGDRERHRVVGAMGEIAQR